MLLASMKETDSVFLFQGHGHNVISGAQNPINTSQALVLAQQQVQHLGTK